jgi:hypothetical protein
MCKVAKKSSSPTVSRAVAVVVNGLGRDSLRFRVCECRCLEQIVKHGRRDPLVVRSVAMPHSVRSTNRKVQKFSQPRNNTRRVAKIVHGLLLFVRGSGSSAVPENTVDYRNTVFPG